MLGLSDGKWDQVRRRLRDRDSRVDADIGADMHELTGGKYPPAALSVELLGGDDDRGHGFERGYVHRGRHAADMQARFSWTRACWTLQNVQGMLTGVAQRPQLTGRPDDGV